MRSLPLIVIGALLAGLIAAGVFLIRQAEARAEEQQAAAERAAEHEAELRDSAAAQDVAVEQRLDAIEVALESMGRRMDELQARDARSQEITDASIEAAVRSWLEKNREKVSGGMPGPEKRPKAATPPSTSSWPASPKRPRT
ncbi:MAG: hypothetical protein ACE5F1_19105 [Planctomycetota bacterium]